MKGYQREEWQELTAPERERLEARYRAFVEATAKLRALAGEDVEPCWALALEVER